jgi:hypothetical protein
MASERTDSSLDTAPMTELERNRLRLTMREQQNTFQNNPSTLMLEMMVKDSSHPSPLRQMPILSERTPDDSLYHTLWFLHPPDSQIEQHPFHEYYEYCVRESSRLNPEDPPYSLAIFTERYKDALSQEPIIAKISGAREFPATSEEEQKAQRIISFHLIHQDGILVYTLPYRLPSMDENSFEFSEENPEAVAYRSCSATKRFYCEHVRELVKFYRSPEGWEGLDGEMKM